MLIHAYFCGGLIKHEELLLFIAERKFQAGDKLGEIAALIQQNSPPGTKKIDGRNMAKLFEEAGQWLLREYAESKPKPAPESEETKLAAALVAKFGLLDARVVRGGEIRNPASYARLIRSYGEAAASYFEGLVEAADESGEELYVAVSGGQPILDMVSALKDRERPNVHWYAAAMIGRGMMNFAPHVGPETNSTIAWARSGRLPGHLYYGTVEPYEVEAKELKGKNKRERHDYGRREIRAMLKNQLLAEPLRELMKDMNSNVNVAFAGLGIPHATGLDEKFGEIHIERLTMTNLLTPVGIDPEILASEGAVGDLSYCLFDAEGNGKAQWKFFLTAGEGTAYSGVEFYRNLVKRGGKVIVMGGVRKEEAVRAALRQEDKLFNVLVTDASTAGRLLE